ncbi:MAG: lactate utilization protein [Bauldia sp.]
MSSRDAIFSRIRKSLGVDSGDAGRRAVVIGRLDSARRGVIPARGQLPREERIALFAKMAEKTSATVVRVATAEEFPEEVARFLRSHNIPAEFRMGDDLRLDAMPWEWTQTTIRRGAAEGSDVTGVSHAQAGVAESGTLVLTSGPDNPTTINFLPENHIVAIAASDVLGDYESAWDMLRERYGKAVLPRTVNMITGPSRSADIEQTLLLGAHGPRRLHIVIVG